MHKFIKAIYPPKKWRFPVVLMLGVLCGFIAYILHISNFTSYFSDKPETCVNCHVMAPQYATWSHSSHREVANCNACHVPHNNVFNKYYFKAKDGLRHATIFTLRNEPQVIFIKEEGKKAVQDNCIRCHNDLITQNEMPFSAPKICCTIKERKCWDCHREVPHGRVNSLSSVPHARVPLLESPVPEWLDKLIKSENN